MKTVAALFSIVCLAFYGLYALAEDQPGYAIATGLLAIAIQLRGCE